MGHFTQPSNLRERVFAAAEKALEAAGSVGPLELLQWMSLLQPSHVEDWRKGRVDVLEPLIQGSPEKLAKSYTYFQEWVEARQLRPVPAQYLRAGPRGNESLQVTVSGDPSREEFFRTHYAPADLPERKAKQLKAKLAKPPDLVVFQTVAELVVCSECGAELSKGNLLTMEKGKPLCLSCADMDHLEFLPSGDATWSRRARKHSPLSAVVVRFNRSRKRYERQGLLVTPNAIALAEAECLADAPERAVQRDQAAERRRDDDAEFVEQLCTVLREQYPGCPPDEIRDIARHTALRGSGRVGRSAAGRALDPGALRAAVVAHVRHVHTNYDELLMQGTDREHAREQIREKVDEVLQRWASD